MDFLPQNVNGNINGKITYGEKQGDRKLTMKIRDFIPESVVTASPIVDPDTPLGTWQEQNKDGKVVQKNINAIKVMEYTF